MSLGYIDIHTHNPNPRYLSIKSLYRISESPEQSENLFYSFGFHPWFLGDLRWEEAQVKLEELSSFENIIAFGEIGLDRVCDTPYEVQIEWFEHQLEFFIHSKFKVCFIHCVRAWNDIQKAFKDKSNSLVNKFFILHDFNASASEFEQLLKNPNLYFSLGQNFLRPQSKIHQYLDKIPHNRLFFETDDSGNDITVPYNEYSVRTGIKLDQLQQVILSNYHHLFTLTT